MLSPLIELVEGRLRAIRLRGCRVAWPGCGRSGCRVRSTAARSAVERDREERRCDHDCDERGGVARRCRRRWGGARAGQDRPVDQVRRVRRAPRKRPAGSRARAWGRHFEPHTTSSTAPAAITAISSETIRPAGSVHHARPKSSGAHQSTSPTATSAPRALAPIAPSTRRSPRAPGRADAEREVESRSARDRGRH